ncbi:type I polyketide synthase [Pseudanabaena sp. ABRG5-3]|uniref:type I polyketide synthase n=1 Tax=Pseudanabaena sp. ABRG5-3 TaxID=685565 RepID=UPI000DC6DE18|nr:type I polyketide synthase [Pseudanabaena sp. ABRG5-3]BBC27199.1 6-deoxyerythronolide-B synthase [Pseudanabaena sp. ABRG5-3]
MHDLENGLADYLEPYGDGVEPIAIVGMSGKFPNAKNIDEFWQNLRDGVESISFFDDQDLFSVDPNLLANPDYVKAFGALADIEWFDANFFGFNAREAEVMDPQHRLFLETAWEALESAGYNPETYNGQIGVYAGASVNSYWINNLAQNQELSQLVSYFQILLGNDKDFVSTRVSYKLNLKGPSINVSTACSTSLVAVQMACQSLLNYQCDMALAGGVAIRTPQKQGYLYQKGMILSPDGHCRTFDAKAKGTVGGSGVGIVVLKRLSEAIADRDFIYALIRGAAINNDGASKIGYTAPSIDGQAAVITEAQSLAGINPSTISYIEAHGTGTELGDPIEIAALSQAFRANTQSQGQSQQRNFCAIGSLKTNVGHLDTAAGVAGLIKTALALHHQQIPPSLHFQQPNPKIDFGNSPFFVNTTLQDWESKHSPRRAGVSSFGIGGTNAHVVLEEAPQIPELELSGESRRFQLLLISAKTSTALDQATTNLAHHLQTSQQKLADIAYTLKIGRQSFKYRRMLVCENTPEAIADLQNASKLLSQGTESTNTPVVFMFSGQGSQYVNMGKDLYDHEAVFREYFDRCCNILLPILGNDLRQIIYPNADRLESSTHQLQQTAIAQPAIFAIAYALAQQWIAWGIKPKAMIGHSIGEYVAACLSGVMTLQEALAIVAIRGKLMQQLPAGAMLAIPLTEQEIEPWLGSDLSIAAINSSNLCVVSGEIDAIAQLEQKLKSQEVDCRRLHTSHAFHSSMMEPMLTEFRSHIAKVRLNPPQIPYISNVSGNWITAREATDPDYWVRHIRQPVNFAAGLQILLQEPQQVLLEIGAGRTLSTLAKRHSDKKLEQVVLTSLRHPQEQQSDLAFLLSTLGQLWMSGVNIDWNAFYEREKRSRLPLPTYPFERQYYWIEPSNSKLNRQLSQAETFHKKDLADWFYIPSWKRSPITVDSPTKSLANKHCLIFDDRKEFTTKLVTHLQTLYQNVICVEIGEKFAKSDDFSYILNPHHSEDYDLLLANLPNFQTDSYDLLHLWMIEHLDDNDNNGGKDFLNNSNNLDDLDNLEQIEQCQIKGFYSLVFLAQAIGKLNLSNELHLFAISNNMQNIADQEQQYPEKATILGALKVIPKEYPQITCRSIDILLPPPETKQEQQLIAQLVEELVDTRDKSNHDSPLQVIAYRGNHRWQQTYEPIHIEANNSRQSKLRSEGVYLITGGLGGIGLTLAEHISSVSKPKLILTSRSPFPSRDHWSSWLTEHPESDRTSQTIQKLQALEKQGAEILVAQADVANLEEMQTLVAEAIAKFGKIDGLIHCAGVPSGSIMLQKTKSELAQVLAPKVAGTFVLHQIFQETPLDFVVLCSSLSSIFGVFAQVDYCAANTYLDAFAQAVSLEWHIPVISINWDTWQQVGMAVDIQMPEDLQDSYQSILNYGIQPDEGMEVFNRLLGTNLSQVLVSTRDLYSRLTQLSPLERNSPVSTSLQADLAKPSHARPHLNTAYVAPTNEIETKLAEIWQQLLGIEAVGIYDNFFELGGHSLLGTQLISRIRQSLQIEMPLSYLFAEPTVARLADYVNDSHSKSQGLESDSHLSTSDREEGEI